MGLFGKKSESKPELRATETEGASPAAAKRAYGIDDAIHLMRTLPMKQNQDLILLVMRNTLSSMNVSLEHVIQDGSTKQERLANTITSIKATLAELEAEMATRKHELAGVEADLAETTAVKESLVLAAQREAPIVHPSPAPKPPVPAGRSGLHPLVTGGDRETMEVDPQDIETASRPPPV